MYFLLAIPAMYFLCAIPALALLVILAAWFYDLTKGFRRSPKKVVPSAPKALLPKGTVTYHAQDYSRVQQPVVPSDVLADALIQHMLESDRSH